MRAAYLTGLRQLEVREEPEPAIERPGDARVRIDRVGVCGSDVHYYTEGRIGPQVCRFPVTVGHECSGTVMEVGPAVEGLKPGDRVAVDPALVCGTCDQCQAGRRNTCRNIWFMGSPGQAPGAAAEYRIVPGENCLTIPDSVSLDQAALAEPLTIGMHAVRLAELYPGARVAVLGSGPIGLSVLVCARASAPVAVYVTDPIAGRRAVAEAYGADWTGSPDEVAATIAEREPRGLDAVFECSGDPSCIGQAAELLTPGGRLMLVGIPPTPEVSVDVHTMRTKELVLQNVRRQKGCIAPVIRSIAQGLVDTRPMLTHHFPLEAIGEAFELVAGYRDGVIKAMLRVGPGE